MISKKNFSIFFNTHYLLFCRGPRYTTIKYEEKEKSRVAIIIIIKGVCAVGAEDVRPTLEVTSYRITQILARALCSETMIRLVHSL